MKKMLLACAVVLGASAAVAETQVDIGFLRVDVPQPAVLSNLDPIPEDEGLAGATLGLTDNNTTGRFLGQSYRLIDQNVPVDGDIIAAAEQILSQTDLLVLDAPAEVILKIADLPAAKDAMLFNAAAQDDALRSDQCRVNLFHTIPSHAMRADALMQFFLARRWDDIVMIAGTHPDDAEWAAALERSATKFGLKIRARKDWAFDADMRRNASQEVPLFTQDFGDYDVLLVADETDDFGRYIAYNTWLPRPIAGSEGLRPRTWAPVVEQWGAVQLQSRFNDQSARDMRPRDYAAWAAVRAIGEAVTRTNQTDTATLRAFMLSDDFELAGFRGRPLTWRDWNGQLRQSIPLVTERAVVANAPLPGFLHQHNELDTLGIDRPESACTAFN